MPDIQQSERTRELFYRAMEICTKYRHEFLTPEHLLLAMLEDLSFFGPLVSYCSLSDLREKVEEQTNKMERVPDDREDYEPQTSMQLHLLLDNALQQVYYGDVNVVDMPHLIRAMLQLEDSWACYLLKQALGDDEQQFMSDIITTCAIADLGTLFDENGEANAKGDGETEDTEETEEAEEEEELVGWRRMVVCMNAHAKERNPLVGREKELERTIQVLCRRDKNNPLHVGEPGVGKTALVWGLASRINSGDVPRRLQGSRIYQLDLGTLLAGTQYRGEFEKRIKKIMDGISSEGKNNIIYIDEIHTLVGAGSTGDSSMDASNMLKPYLEAGNLRFIGSTTYEEYNKYFSRSKGLVRRFQQIDLAEPTMDEAKHILRQLRPKYEEFHNVVIEDAAIDFAVEASAKHVNDRCLPDKAIDLVDEAGAAMELRPQESGIAVVTQSLIADILAKTCKVDALAMKDDNTAMEHLSERVLASIYGQDEAVRQVVEAVQMAKAGLTDDNKPLASLLFVGPTGVGKTEVARVLARELGIELLRFDMSEYTEKHTVAKLIGSPAGYVGYEDGGLLTDAIRKTPNCVLLLDEIEKAHQDIYNILLQVMDYARLTDNKGRKADFRNVVLIMTSNAGAQYASQASVGFTGGTSRGEAMLRQVKKTFKPEFINRLSGTVVFNDMDRTMATLILRKKLRELQDKLTARQVEMTLTDAAIEVLLNEGFTREYGAREMERVIGQRLKPLLMREILFGTLKQGGTITIETNGNDLQIRR